MLPVETGRVGVQGNYLSFAICQYKQIAADELPKRSRAILNGGFVIGQSLKRAGLANQPGDLPNGTESNLLLLLETSEGADRVVEMGSNFLPYL